MKTSDDSNEEVDLPPFPTPDEIQAACLDYEKIAKGEVPLPDDCSAEEEEFYQKARQNDWLQKLKKHNINKDLY